jgi:enamine deaminase RidA (YjgF/YER057c/UK114 family)
MTARRSISVPGLDHGDQPFPIASRIGPFLATSGIHGVDPATGKPEGDAAAQIRQAFANLRAVLAEAGASPDDVAQVLVTLTDREHRKLVNESWVELFPDPASRPARQTSERELPGGSLCMLVAYAYVA